MNHSGYSFVNSRPEIHAPSHRFAVFVRQMSVNLADEHATVTMTNPRRNRHEIHAGHDAHGNEMVPAIVKIKIRHLCSGACQSQRFTKSFGGNILLAALR